MDEHVTNRSKKKLSGVLSRYRPPQGDRWRQADEAIAETERNAAITVFAPSGGAWRVRAQTKSDARSDVRAGSLVIQDDGLACSPTIDAERIRTEMNMFYNVRHFYAATLPTVANILEHARKLAAAAPRESMGRPGQGADASANAATAEVGGANPRARRAQLAAANAAARRQGEHERAFGDLSALLSVYESEYLLLRKRLDTCSSMYREQTAFYLKEALRAGHGLVGKAFTGGKRLQVTPTALASLHVAEPELPALPVDLFAGMSAADVVARASELRLPAEYGRAAFNGAAVATTR